MISIAKKYRGPRLCGLCGARLPTGEMGTQIRQAVRAAGGGTFTLMWLCNEHASVVIRSIEGARRQYARREK